MSVDLIEIVDGVHINRTAEWRQAAAEARQREAERAAQERQEQLKPKNMAKRLRNILQEHDADVCECGHYIGFGDIAWNNGCTEYGTGYSTVEIQCVGCDREIAHIDSWYPSIDDRDDLLGVLERDWGKHI